MGHTEKFTPFGGEDIQEKDIGRSRIVILPLCYENEPSYGSGSRDGIGRKIKEVKRGVVQIKFFGHRAQDVYDGRRVGPADENEAFRFQDTSYFPHQVQRVYNMLDDIKKRYHVKCLTR